MNDDFRLPIVTKVQQKSLDVARELNTPSNNKFLVPIREEMKGAAKNILKGYGLGLIKPKLFVYNREKLEQEQAPFNRGEVGAGAEYDKKNYLGLPVFDTVTLVPEQITYEDENGNNVSVGTVHLDIAIIEVVAPKNIVKTQIAGRSGTVKEYMGDDDYHIKIVGCLVNEYFNHSPDELIIGLNEVKKIPTEVEVTSNFLNFFGIYTIVVEDITFKQREGERNVVDYEITALSDTPFEIQQAYDTTTG